LTPQILELRGKKQKEEKENIIKKIGFQFDFYAIGIIFYEMLTGEKPYKYREEDEDKPSILWYPINYDIPVISKISSVPPEAENIILRLMASKNISTDNHLVIEKDGYEELPDDYVKPYEDVNEIIMEVEKLQKDLNTNNVIELNQKLLKPFNERVFQNSSKMFSIKNEKIKLYDKV
jgi:serine/threonine-protein kinase